MNRNKFILGALGLFASVAMFTACKNNKSTGLEFARNMYDHLGFEQDQPNNNFANGLTAQTPPKHSVPVGFDSYKFPNTKEGYEASAGFQNPLEKTGDNLVQGKKMYLVYCSPCHGEKGDGQGHIVKLDKGISAVPPYHGTDAMSSRGGLMKDMPAGKIYHSIYYGLNAMGSHASQLTPSERWRVVMYVQELQKLQ